MPLITLTLKKWRRNPLSQTRIERALATLQNEYAEGVVSLYDLTTAGWDEAPHASAIVRENFGEGGKRRVNVYQRGAGVQIWEYLNAGFMRKVAIIPGYTPRTIPGRLTGVVGGGRPGGGPVTGRMLKQPKPVAARRWTEQIAEIVRNGDRSIMPYGEFMRRGFHERVMAKYIVTKTVK